MVAVLPFGYIPTVNAIGAFGTASTSGAVQGTMMDNPSTRYQLRSGVVAYTETLPMWGGVGIYENVPNDPSLATAPISQFGSVIGRATTLAGTTGKARFGSGMQIAVQCDPSLVVLEGDSINQQVSWDFNNQVLQPYDAATATYALTSATWAATNGGQITVVMAVASLVGGVGDLVFISGATNTGTGGAAAVNGMFVVSAFTDNQHFILAAPAAAGVIGTIGGSPVLNAGQGALPVRIDSFFVGNSMAVRYNPSTGFGSWIYNATLAVLTI